MCVQVCQMCLNLTLPQSDRFLQPFDGRDVPPLCLWHWYDGDSWQGWHPSAGLGTAPAYLLCLHLQGQRCSHMGIFLEVPSKASCQWHESPQSCEWPGEKFPELDSSPQELPNCNTIVCSVSPVNSESESNRYLQILTLGLLIYAFAHLPLNCTCIGIVF